MAKFKVHKESAKRVRVTVMMPDGFPIGTTDKDGCFETDNEEHIKILTTDVRYDYVEAVGAAKRRAKADATDSEDVLPPVQE